MNIETHPPFYHLHSTPLSKSTAADLLSTFLSLSESTPHLHPDALITPSGVSFSTNGGSAGGAILHNLRRVEQGMRGVYLEPSPSPEPEGRDGEGEGQNGWNGRVNKGMVGRKEKLKGAEGVGEEMEGWQDIEEFQMEEGGVQVGEIGDRGNGAGDGEVPEVQETGEKKRKMGEGRKLDKEARRVAKKRRMKELQKEKEKKRSMKE